MYYNDEILSTINVVNGKLIQVVLGFFVSGFNWLLD